MSHIPKPKKENLSFTNWEIIEMQKAFEMWEEGNYAHEDNKWQKKANALGEKLFNAARKAEATI